MLVRIRIDDVMGGSSAFTKERGEHRFNQIHRWIVQSKSLIHVPTILVEDIQKYPNIIDLIKTETAAGKMDPQLHGYQHIDYGAITPEEIDEHLVKSIKWFQTVLNKEPTVWATPWGAYSETIKEAASKRFLEVETTANIIPPGRAVEIAKNANSIRVLFGQTVMTHWWSLGLNILRLVEIANYGSYKTAARKRPQLFGDKDGTVLE